MNFKLNCQDFENYLVQNVFETILGSMGRRHYVFKFDNNYGASVVKSPGSYGYENDLWELAVIRFWCDDDWDIDYDTPIASSVVGYLHDEEVLELLTKIKEL